MTQAFTADDAREIWPDYRPTPLLERPDLAVRAGVARVLVKAEAERPLGNFKSLGGLVAGLRALARAAGVPSIRALEGVADHPRLVCASDGNHGLAVTAAAQRVGTRAAVFLPRVTPLARARRIEALGGEVVWVEGDYDEAVRQAAAAAARGEGLLVPDTTEDAGDPVVADVMAGYGLMMREAGEQLAALDARPTHAFAQAGVGGLAAAVAQGMEGWPGGPAKIVVVEPAAAACVGLALETGRPTPFPGDLETAAGMLSCGIASTPALAVLQRCGARAIAVSELELTMAVPRLAAGAGPASTPSGAAGLAGLLHVADDARLRQRHGLEPGSVVLLIATEAAIAESGQTAARLAGGSTDQIFSML